MSLLAKLRQQAPRTDGPALCYLLEYQPTRRPGTPATLQLHLMLGETRRGAVHHLTTPYAPSRAHLQQPPSFLDAADMALLEGLAGAGEGPSLGEKEGAARLDAALATGRCLLRAAGSEQWQPLAGGAPQPLALAWEGQGGHLPWPRWHSPGRGRVVALEHASGPLLILDRQGGASLHLPTNPPPAAARAAVAAWREDGETPASAWRDWRLPPPPDFSHRVAQARLTPVLRCHPGGGSGAGECLDLLWCYQTESYACAPGSPSPLEATHYWQGWERRDILRDPAREASFMAQLAPRLAGFKTSPDTPLRWHCNEPGAWLTLLADHRPDLEALGFTFLHTPGFRHHYLVAGDWQARLEELPDGDWRLALEASTASGPVNLLQVLARCRPQPLADQTAWHSLALADGRLLLMPVTRLRELVAALGDHLDDDGTRAGAPLRFSRHELSRLPPLARALADGCHWGGDADLLDRARRWGRLPESLQGPPPHIRATLRPYQWLGVCWLQHLREQGLNGLLADDMGLGKTLQTLAHLCIERDRGRLLRPALIVAPRSLVENWRREAEHFTPQLRVCVMHGPGRHSRWQRLTDHDVLISSYGAVLRDQPRWAEAGLSWLILDEAQAIKNPRARVGRALRDIPSEHRLCLSGTPVENHLGELWSLLDFLLPGVLGSQAAFNEHFRRPIEEDADGERLQSLLARVEPFMLRRTKREVAADLPAKTEVCLRVAMTPAQRDCYRRLLADDPRGGESASAGAQQMRLLTALLRLRQACCDPRLLGERDAPSGKLQHCLAMLAQLTRQGRRVLVFSQFARMLELLRGDLARRGIDSLLLTGATADRQALVDAFQRGESAVFLISLKAGGVGLNLTAADTVIHYDPWWNPSAQRQATDRAHRLGQDKAVFEYRLITEDSIEEQVLALQAGKEQLHRHVEARAESTGLAFGARLDELLALWREEAGRLNP